MAAGAVRFARVAFGALGLIAVVAVGFGVVGWLNGGPGPLGEAEEAYARGDWSRAVERAREGLKASMNDVEAARLLARASARLGRDEAALGLYQDRVGVDRMAAEDHYLLGLLIERQGNPALALDVWGKALREDPNDPELLEGVARLAAGMGRFEVSAEAAETLAGLSGHESRGWLLLGASRSEMDDAAGAAEALGKGLQADPSASTPSRSNASFRALLARNLLKLGRPSEARAALAIPPGGGAADEEAAWLADRADLQEGREGGDPGLASLVDAFQNEHPLDVEPAPYVGSARCLDCHEEVGSGYAATRHARTFHHGEGLRGLPFPDGPLPDPDHPETASHVFERGEEGERPRVLTRAGDEVSRLVVDFAFGTPERYLTMVGRDDSGAFRAARLSHYHQDGAAGWDRTSGDGGDPGPDADVRGQVIHARDGVVRCLACHVTNPRDFILGDSGEATKSAAATDAAIGCERCHGPGTHHLAAVKLGRDDPAILNVGRARSAIADALCRECHVVGDPAEIAASPADPLWVRSPGVTITFSRCKTADGSPIGCLTCHDPHRDAPTSATFYEEKCLGCHAEAPRTAAGPGPAVCKVGPRSGCLDCHMPKVPVPSLHDELTDHYIRVRPEGP